MKYEGVYTLEDVIRISEKKNASLESSPIILLGDTTEVNATSLGALPLTSLFQPLYTPSRMDVAMKQLMSQMTQLSIHLPQL